MTLRLASCAFVLVVVAASLTAGAQRSGAKALFHGPPGSTPNPYGSVGIHYWFENPEGSRFTRARNADVGSRLRLLTGKLDAKSTTMSGTFTLSGGFKGDGTFKGTRQ